MVIFDNKKLFLIERRVVPSPQGSWPSEILDDLPGKAISKG